MTKDNFNITDQGRDYSPLGLEQNPYPYSPVPADNPDIYCGQERVADIVSETISSVLGTGKSKHLVITGKYGNGKSHTLKHARSLISDRDDVIVGYVAQPGEGFLDIYHEFVFDLGFDGIQQLSYEFLTQVIQDETEKNPNSVSETESLIDDGAVLLSEIVPSAIQRLSDVTKFADFARAMIHMIYQDTNLYAWQWIAAEGIRYEQRKEMEIHSALDDDTMGVRAFTSMKRMLLELGYTGVFAFVDEFESVARLSPKTEQSILNSIRHLMDQNSSGMCMMFGCAPEVWQEVMSEYHAFSERIGREVSLKPLTEDALETLMQVYLNENGETDLQVGDLFADGTIRSILQGSQGNIRQALFICSYSVDEALDRGGNRVTDEDVESVIR